MILTELSRSILKKCKYHFSRLSLSQRLFTAGLFIFISVFFLLFTIAIIHGLADTRLKKLYPSRLFLDRTHTFIASVENQYKDYGYWKMPDSLPSTLVTAALAAEDRRFHYHPGIDFYAVGRAFIDNYIRRRGYSGASTIAMQVARLQRGSGGGWYFKVHDAAAALGMTTVFGRERVLRHYFRITPYGNRISGAACASRRYFYKPVQDLSPAEAALLASIPKAPSRFNLFNDKGFALARRRAKLIIDRSLQYGWISPATHSEALSELSSLSRPVKQTRSDASFHFIEACKSKLDGKGSGVIRTTLDSRIQDSVNTILRLDYPRMQQFEARNAAAMVVDLENGHVLAYIGSVDYYSKHGGAINCAALPRSTGSLLKPFIYAAGMEWQGYNASTVLTDVGFDFGKGPRSFIPENYDRKFMGPVLYKVALANSRNVPSVQVLNSIGVDLFYRMCISLGLTDDDGKAQYYGLGLSIGGLYCSQEQLMAAYMALANKGLWRDLVWQMDLPDTSEQRGRQVIHPEIAMQIRRFLSDPNARLPSFPRGGNMEYPFAVAVKTGTSEGFRDSWCLAFSDKYLVGVWLGNTDFSPTKRFSGYEGAAAVVKKILMFLHPDRAGGLNDLDFPPPEGYEPVRICRLTGKKADRFTPYVTTEYFKPGTEPVEYSNVQQMLPIDKRNGLIAFPGCRAPIEYRRFIVLSPEYYDWARSQGLEVPPERYSPLCGEIPPSDNYEISITSPRSNTRFYLDPEMPPGKSTLTLNCRALPQPASVLWFVNGQEYRVASYPFKLEFPMSPGKYEFQAAIPHTDVKSKPVNIEIY